MVMLSKKYQKALVLENDRFLSILFELIHNIFSQYSLAAQNDEWTTTKFSHLKWKTKIKPPFLLDYIFIIHQRFITLVTPLNNIEQMKKKIQLTKKLHYY